MTTECHEFFGCTRTECVMFKEGNEKKCWEHLPELTPCIDATANPACMEDKKVYCKNCLYYEYANRTPE